MHACVCVRSLKPEDETEEVRSVKAEISKIYSNTVQNWATKKKAGVERMSNFSSFFPNTRNVQH